MIYIWHNGRRVMFVEGSRGDKVPHQTILTWFEAVKKVNPNSRLIAWSPTLKWRSKNDEIVTLARWAMEFLSREDAVHDVKCNAPDKECTCPLRGPCDEAVKLEVLEEGA